MPSQPVSLSDKSSYVEDRKRMSRRENSAAFSF